MSQTKKSTEEEVREVLEEAGIDVDAGHAFTGYRRHRGIVGKSTAGSVHSEMPTAPPTEQATHKCRHMRPSSHPMN